jgi:hypothetical protein
MPKKYWHNMPETAANPALVREATTRVEAMVQMEPTTPRFAAIRHSPFD